MNKIKAGEVIAIPLENGKIKRAHIAYASEYFKEVILLAFFPGVSDEPLMPETAPEKYENEAIYTGSDIINKGHWMKLGYLDLPEHIPESRRIVGGDIWLGDECLGPAPDNSTLPKMLTYGYKLVEKKLNEKAI